MHRFARFITLFALVAHGMWGCCAHHVHADERSSTRSLQAACCSEHHGTSPWGAESSVNRLDANNDHAARDRHDERGHDACHESPCSYVAPNNSYAASDLGFDATLPVVVHDTMLPVKPALSDDLPIRERLLAPRSHFLNQTLLL